MHQTFLFLRNAYSTAPVAVREHHAWHPYCHAPEHPSPRLDGMVQITACFMVASSLPRLSPCFASFCLTRCIALIEAVLCCSQHLPGHGRFTSLVASSLPLFDSVLLTAIWCLIAASSQPHCPLLLSLLLAAPACNGTNRIKVHACINPPS